MSSEPGQPVPTSVYVHFPWCARKCPYCDFATEPVKTNTIPHEPYTDAVLRELSFRAADLQGRELTSVFFGGGTPSLWDVKALKRALEGIEQAFDRVSDDIEVTVECNPSSLSRRHARELHEAGVGRLSIGVQSLRDDHLQFLGRLHDSKRAVATLEDACAEVPRVSTDLMFGMPGQQLDAFGTDIERIVATGVRHVSAYALTIEEKTLFGSLHKAGKLRVAPEDRYADLFELAQRRFTDLGWNQYEVSNYAAEGEESRHNLHYWRGGAYVGLGAAAVGCLDRGPGDAFRWRNEPIPQRYLAQPTHHSETERLGPDEIVREALMLGLRTARGMHLATTRQRADQDPWTGRERGLELAIQKGDLVHNGDWLRVPKDRWLKLDGIVRDLF
ncbi:MAG: radical SAM family heme chaperone HemW [Myxococcales bacterium]|nr:radical SAM family heme chaperone HemW [Myxococcales bacterium]MDH3485078.1 radical SAM family heme chaperone HemW [Myxococcales bacterium]